MPVLFLADGSTPFKDKAGNALKTGQTITDEMFDDGIIRGTVPLEKGENLNAVIDWLGPGASGKPRSRSPEHFKLKIADSGSGFTTRTHSGADYESGRVYDERGRNDSDAGESRCAASEATNPGNQWSLACSFAGSKINFFVQYKGELSLGQRFHAQTCTISHYSHLYSQHKIPNSSLLGRNT